MNLPREYRPLLIFSVISNLLMLVAPLHMMQVYDRVLSSGSNETLLYITLIGLCMLAFYGVSETIRTRLAQRIANQYTVNRADKLFALLMESPGAGSAGPEMMGNFTTVRNFIGSRTMIGLFDLPFAPLFLVLLYVIHIQIGLLTTVGLGALIGIAWLNNRQTAGSQMMATSASEEARQFAYGVFGRSDDIRAMGLVPSLSERWGRLMGGSINAQDSYAYKNATFFGLSKSIRQSLQILILAWGAWLVLQGQMSGGIIIAASIMSGRTLQPIDQVIGAWDNINRARSASAEVEKFLENDIRNNENLQQPVPVGNFSASGISYSVPGKDGDIALLNDISVSIAPGEILAVVGASGSGKSTFARIAAGSLEPTTGKIQLDGCAQPNWLQQQWGTICWICFPEYLIVCRYNI